MVSADIRGVMVQTPFAAAGFLFYAGNILREVPFDPHLPYLFDGEEILYSARLWTHG
jgi:UDP-GlcNAc:polypeptide alpha-N-acetylglucosaminyltransferase